MITPPRMPAGSSARAVWIAASIPGYSPPCTPAVTLRTGPGAAPRTTVTGIAIGVPGTSRKPVTLLPGAARSAPTSSICTATPPCGRRRLPPPRRRGLPDPRQDRVDGERPDLHREHLTERPHDDRLNFCEGNGAPEQAGHAGDRFPQPARVDHPEVVQVGRHVQCKPVHRDPAFDGHADRGDLGVPDPHAWIPAQAGSGDSEPFKGADQGGFEPADVADDVLVERAEVEDRIPHQLPGPVIGHVPSALGCVDVEPLGRQPPRRCQRLGGRLALSYTPVMERMRSVPYATRNPRAIPEADHSGARSRRQAANISPMT